MNAKEKMSSKLSGSTLWARLALAYFKKRDDEVSKAITEKLTERCDKRR